VLRTLRLKELIENLFRADGFGEGSPVFQPLETNPGKETGFGAEGGGGVENNPV